MSVFSPVDKNAYRMTGEFKQTTDLFHGILIDDKAQTSSALPCATPPPTLGL